MGAGAGTSSAAAKRTRMSVVLSMEDSICSRVVKYLIASRGGRPREEAFDSRTGHRPANFVTGTVSLPLGPRRGSLREGGGIAEPAVDRAQRSRRRKTPARPATQDREGVYRE